MHSAEAMAQRELSQATNVSEGLISRVVSRLEEEHYVLGDMVDDLLIIVGLVPSLIVDQVDLPEGTDAHVGTMDLDVGLQLALLDEGRYRKLTERLRDAGFEMDENDDGRPTRQRWAITNSGTLPIASKSGAPRSAPPR